MTIPGFTAEGSIYKTSQSYSTARPFHQATTGGIRPAQLLALAPISRGPVVLTPISRGPVVLTPISRGPVVVLPRLPDLPPVAESRMGCAEARRYCAAGYDTCDLIPSLCGTES